MLRSLVMQQRPSFTYLPLRNAELFQFRSVCGHWNLQHYFLPRSLERCHLPSKRDFAPLAFSGWCSVERKEPETSKSSLEGVRIEI